MPTPLGCFFLLFHCLHSKKLEKHFFSYWFCPLLLNKSCILLNFLCGQHSCPLFIFVCTSSKVCSSEHALNQGHRTACERSGLMGHTKNQGLSDSLEDFGFLFHAEIRLSVTRAYQLILRHYFNKCLWQIHVQRCSHSSKSPFVYFSADMIYINKNTFKLNPRNILSPTKTHAESMSGLALKSCQCCKTNAPLGWLVEWINFVTQRGQASWFWCCLKGHDELGRNSPGFQHYSNATRHAINLYLGRVYNFM